MAKFYVKDYVKANDVSGVVAVSWQVALDEEFTIMVDEVSEYRDNVEVWFSSLYRIDGPGMYDENTKLYVRCKIHSENMGKVYDSDWYIAKLNDTVIKENYLIDNTGNKICKIIYDDSEDGYHIEY